MTRREWLAAALITVVALAAAVYLLRDDSGDPAPRSDDAAPSARVMTIAAADELLARLSQAGWDCFNSLRDPVVKRCFLDESVNGGGTVSAEVALTYADGYVDRASVYAAGERDGGRHLTVGRDVARLAGDILLDGAGDEVADQLGVRQEIQISGRRVYGTRAPGASVQVVVESASYDGRGLPPPDLPAKDVLVGAAESAGLLCHDDGSSTSCSGTVGSISMTVTMSEVAGRIGSLSMSASNFEVPDDPAVVNMVTGYLFETGVGGPRSAAWVREHVDSPTPARADLGGVQLRLTDGGDRAVYLTTGAILN